MNSIGKNIKQMRTEKSWTQQQLADRLFVTRQAVSNWENGKTEPDADTLLKIADIMQADIRDIVENSPQKETVTVSVSAENKKGLEPGIVFLTVIIVILIFFRYFYPWFKDLYFESHIVLEYDIHKRYSRVSYRLSVGALVSAAALETISAVLIVRLMRLWGKIKPVKQNLTVKIIRRSLIILFSLHLINMILPDIDFIFGLNLLDLFHKTVKPVLKILGNMRLAAFYPARRWVFFIIGAVMEMLRPDKIINKI